MAVDAIRVARRTTEKVADMIKAARAGPTPPLDGGLSVGLKGGRQLVLTPLAPSRHHDVQAGRRGYAAAGTGVP